MPYVLKPNKLFAKDPNGEGYLPQNVITDQATADVVDEIEEAGAEQVAAIEAKGEEVLESIPSDYTELSDEVEELTEDVADLQTITEHMPPYSIRAFGDYSTSVGAYSISYSGKFKLVDAHGKEIARMNESMSIACPFPSTSSGRPICRICWDTTETSTPIEITADMNDHSPNLYDIGYYNSDKDYFLGIVSDASIKAKDSVRYNTAQNLTSAQKTQARTNIDAADAEEVGTLQTTVGNTPMGTTATTITGAIKEHGDDLGDLKSAFINTNYPGYALLAGKYVSDVDGSYAQSSSGTFSATEHIAVNGAKTLVITATRASQYNAFYDSSDAFISAFSVQIGTNNIAVPSTAVYFALSNITANMQAETVVLPSLTNLFKAAENAVMKMPSNGGLTDANDAEINRIYLLTDITNVSNLPVAAQGTLITLARDSSATTQLYINASKNMFYRACWGTTWSDWKKVLVDGEAITPTTYESGTIPFTVSNDGKYVSEVDGTLQQSSSGAFQHTDFLPLNGLGKLIITTNRASIYNAVYDSNKNFINAFTVQIGKNVVTVPANAAYFRLSNIKANLEATSIMLPALTSAESMMCNGNLLSAFSNIACCGDSLTWSMVYTGNSSSRQAYKTYPAILATETGADTEIFATAGYSASAWWTAYNESIEQKDNQLAIIYLGTNSGLTDTLATDAPTGTDPSTWAETQTGYYARIVAAWQSVGAKVMLVKCYNTSGTGTSDLENTNAAITSIADRFGCGLVENDYIADTVYHMWPNRNGSNTTHYNDLGYAEFTQRLIGYVEFMDRRYLQYIIPD